MRGRAGVGLRLLDGAREAVEDEAALAVVVLDPLLDDTDHQLVAHQPPRRHHVLGLLAHLGLGLGIGLGVGLGVGLGLALALGFRLGFRVRVGVGVDWVAGGAELDSLCEC